MRETINRDTPLTRPLRRCGCHHQGPYQRCERDVRQQRDHRAGPASSVARPGAATRSRSTSAWPGPTRSTAPSRTRRARAIPLPQSCRLARRRARRRTGARRPSPPSCATRTWSSRRESLDAVREFMTDGIDSPLYGRDPLAARRGADALRRAARRRGAAPRARDAVCAQPETSEPPLPLPLKRAAPPAPPASTMPGMTELWGAETRKAIDNFPVSGRPIPVGVVRWLGRIKAAAARVNADLGLLDADLAGRIAAAGDAIAAGDHDDQFPIDVFQTGSGTSSNMNANEVIATLAGEGVHPNDHVNLGPVLERRVPLGRPPGGAGRGDQRPAAGARRAARRRWRPRPRRSRRRQGRPHASDGRRARDARPGVRRLRRADPARARARRGRPPAARPDPARRHRDRHRPEHAPRVRRSACARCWRTTRGSRRRAARPFRGAGEPRRADRDLGRAQGRGRLAHEDRERPPLDGLRPARGARRADPARSCRRARRSCRARSIR